VATFIRFIFASVALLFTASLRAQTDEPRISNPHFMGPLSCKSSGCHGGGVGKGQNLVWERKDVHSFNRDPILSTARSKQMGEALGIADPLKSARCLVCHSPLEALPATRLAPTAKAVRGVTCETCHGPAEKWLLFHTRPDVSHEQRVAMGMRETHDLYNRANVCIACHHMLDSELIEVGKHPEMFFELDGQMEKEPPHWLDEGTWLGPRAWLTGQAAALREISWKLTRSNDPKLLARWKGLIWMLRKTDGGASLPQTDDFAAMQTASDRLARSASRQQWSKSSTMQLFKMCASLAEEFRDGKTEAGELRRRGEVLVFALDRLWHALKANGNMSSENLEKAFAILAGEARRQEGFDPAKFAAALQSVEVALELLPRG
jgi:hypothetical protein